MKRKKMKMKNKKITEKINTIFKENKDDIGSRQRMFFLLDNLKQKDKESINYVVAGSWAIEIISGKSFTHEDIDVICLDDIPHYVDDATSKEESCNGPIPLKKKFLIDNCVEKCSYKGREIFVDSLDLQLALKLIGELDKDLNTTALKQLHALLNVYKARDYDGNNETFILIFEKLLPSIICFDILTEELMSIIKKYSEGKNVDKNLEYLHRIINGALHTEFLKL